MIKTILLSVLTYLILFSNPLQAQEPPLKEEPLPTKLPTVIIKGTDRSYLEIIRAKALPLMEYRGKKELAPPSIQIPWRKKVYYHPLSFPGLERKVTERAPLAPLKPRKKISPVALVLPEFVSPSARYVPARHTRLEALPLMEYRGKKELAPPSIQIPWRKKVYYHPLSFPGLERKVTERAPLAPLKPRKKISPVALVLPEFVSPSARYVPARHTRLEALPLMEHRGKKELAPPSIQIPRGKKVYYPSLRKESPLPYLNLSVSLAPHDSFSYQLDYGRQKERFTGYLSAGSVFTPHWVKYEPEELYLGKHEETIASELIWGSMTNRTLVLNLERQAKKIDFPNEQERNKNEIEIGANRRQEWKTSIFTIDGWANRSVVKDPEVDQEDIALGTGLELRLKKIPLDIGVSVDHSSFSEKTQTHLWLEDDTITFKRIKELTFGLGGGMKAITGSGSQFLPSLKLTYQINPRFQLGVGGKRHFYLARFSDLYFFQDYVEINEDLDPVKIWDYEIKLEYKLSPLANLSLVGFYKEGEDTIWNWNAISSLARPEIRKMNVSGGRLNFLLYFGETFEQGFSYTFQKAENAQDETMVIPHYPQNEGDLWLIGRSNGWAVELGAKYIGKRYYQETSEEKLDSGWIERFKISKKIGKAIELFAQLELNDYDLWRNYPLSKEKISFGLKAKLY